VSSWTIRPMEPADVEIAEQISDQAFFELDLRTFPRDSPDPERRTPDRSANWVRRTLRLLEHDAGGCWVAEDDGEVVGGFATSFVRERVWCLATYAVRPGLQGQGVGRALLDAATAYGDRCEAGMLSASVDARAVRRYWRAGFALHPQMVLRGSVDRAGLGPASGVREGRPDDVDLMDEIARGLRGGGHGPDHASLAELGRPLVAETSSGRGFAYTDGSRLAVLAATDTDTATTLLRACLAEASDSYTIGHVTGANQWAVDVGLRAGLALGVSGYLGVRGMAPPSPYVHNGALL
jgi:predicted N-acetyltransferase YhbS